MIPCNPERLVKKRIKENEILDALQLIVILELCAKLLGRAVGAHMHTLRSNPPKNHQDGVEDGGIRGEGRIRKG